jgi:hypothetical protein
MLVLLLAISAYCRGAAAQADAQAAADALFRAGREATLAEDHQKACGYFRESQRLDPAPGTLLNLAICEERVGHLAQAWQYYRRVFDATSEQDPRRSIVTKNLARLDQVLPRFILQRAVGAPPTTRAQLGAVSFEASTFGVAIPIDPGSHTWVVSAPGHGSVRITRVVSRGERLTLSVKPGPALARSGRTTAVHKPTSAQPPRSKSGRAVGYALLGVGAASLVASGITAALVLDRKSIVAEECDNKICSPDGVEAGRTGHRLALWSTLFFGLGLVTSGSGTYLLLSLDGPARELSASTPSGMVLGLGSKF